MATTKVAGEFSLVYLVWNSISNLRTQQEQVECFRNAASHLAPGGRFVIELWVPALRRLPPGQLAVPMSVDQGHLVLDTYDPVIPGGDLAPRLAGAGRGPPATRAAGSATSGRLSAT